ncbi:hypothetical protein HG440_003430 [Candidatus Saccharibacteria bacterium]|jgi:hypothetical protein|nr:hypothetical protein [Candidatus Saccharibacteria bacterium]
MDITALLSGAVAGWTVSKLADYLLAFGIDQIQARREKKIRKQCLAKLRLEREHALKEAHRRYQKASATPPRLWSYARGSRPGTFIITYHGIDEIGVARLQSRGNIDEVVLEIANGTIKQGWNSGPLELELLGTDVGQLEVMWIKGSSYPEQEFIPVDPADSWIQNFDAYINTECGQRRLDTLINAEYQKMEIRKCYIQNRHC